MDETRFVHPMANGHPNMLGRRRFFTAAAAIAAPAVLPGRADAQVPPDSTAPPRRLTIGNTLLGSPSRIHPSFVKDVGRLQDLNATNQGGAYWNFDTYITPIEDFYIRNAFPTPLPELDRRAQAAALGVWGRMG